ncbi:hypothetical protein [Paraherbaspirillum soli]|uniref:Uncharacterized protein n=1 Tax=Paraherbaspirillum soli TaxID=631222 RepID=A0ABW0M6I6_9BURK
MLGKRIKRIGKARQGKDRGTLFIVIGAQEIESGVHAGGNWLKDSVQRAPLDLTQDAAAPIAALDQIELALKRWRDAQPAAASLKVREVRVLISDIWLATASLPWSGMLKRADTAEAFARGQMEAAGFDLTTADTVKLDDARFGAPRLVLAYPSVLLTAIARLATGVGAVLASVLPLSVTAWEAAPRPQRSKADALLVLERGLLLTAQGSARMSEVMVRAEADFGADAARTEQVLREHIQRMRLRDLHFSQVKRIPVLNLSAAGATLTDADLLCISLPASAVSARLHLAWLSRRCRLAIDAVAAKPAMTAVQWGVAAMAVLLCGGLLFQVWQMHGRVKLVRQQLAASQAAQRPPPAPVAWSREEVTRVQAVNVAIRELNLPIATLLRALQPPADIAAAVLNVEVMGAAPSSTDGSAGVRIVAEAHTGADMARYVAFVAERKPFTGAYLSRHEIVEASPERPYRFTVEAVWAE